MHSLHIFLVVAGGCDIQLIGGSGHNQRYSIDATTRNVMLLTVCNVNVENINTVKLRCCSSLSLSLSNLTTSDAADCNVVAVVIRRLFTFCSQKKWHSNKKERTRKVTAAHMLNI